MPLGQQPIKARQRLRIPSHVVLVFLPVERIGIEQYRQMPFLGIPIGQVDCGFAGENKGSLHCHHLKEKV